MNKIYTVYNGGKKNNTEEETNNKNGKKDIKIDKDLLPFVDILKKYKINTDPEMFRKEYYTGAVAQLEAFIPTFKQYEGKKFIFELQLEAKSHNKKTLLITGICT
jgi:hypothetical protein